MIDCYQLFRETAASDFSIPRYYSPPQKKKNQKRVITNDSVNPQKSSWAISHVIFFKSVFDHNVFDCLRRY
jgi:hypothetical protein